MRRRLVLAALVLLAGCEGFSGTTPTAIETPTDESHDVLPDSVYPAEFGQEVYRLVETQAACREPVAIGNLSTPRQRGVRGAVTDVRWTSIEPPQAVSGWADRLEAFRTHCVSADGQTHRIVMWIRVYENPDEDAPTETVVPVNRTAEAVVYRVGTNCQNPSERIEDVPDALRTLALAAISTGEGRFGGDYVNATVEREWDFHVENYRERCVQYRGATYRLASFNRVYDPPAGS